MESIFSTISCRNSLEIQKEENHCTVITVIYVREQLWIYQNARFQGNNWALTIIVIHLKDSFCDGEEMEEIAPVLQGIQNEVYFIIVAISQFPIW